MNMICQDLSFDHLYAGTLTSTQSSDSHVIGCVRVDTSDTPPGVPGDVREHLEGSMS